MAPSALLTSQKHTAACGPSPYFTPQDFQGESPGPHRTSRGKAQTCKTPAGHTIGFNSHLKTDDVLWLYSGVLQIWVPKDGCSYLLVFQLDWKASKTSKLYEDNSSNTAWVWKRNRLQELQFQMRLSPGLCTVIYFAICPGHSHRLLPLPRWALQCCCLVTPERRDLSCCRRLLHPAALLTLPDCPISHPCPHS